MPILRTCGTIANGWAKFVVALAALGWLGMSTLNRVAPAGEAAQTEIEQPATFEEASEQIASSDEPVDASGESSVVSVMASELGSSATGLLGQRSSQLGMIFLVGLGIGLAARPVVTHVNGKRKLHAAKRRLNRLEEDRQLLGMVSAGISTIPTETEATTSLANSILTTADSQLESAAAPRV